MGSRFSLCCYKEIKTARWVDKSFQPLSPKRLLAHVPWVFLASAKPFSLRGEEPWTKKERSFPPDDLFYSYTPLLLPRPESVPRQGRNRKAGLHHMDKTVLTCPHWGRRMYSMSKCYSSCLHAPECHGWILEMVCSMAFSQELRCSPVRWHGLSRMQHRASCPGSWLGPKARSRKSRLTWAVGTPFWSQCPKNLRPTWQAPTASQICTCTLSKKCSFNTCFPLDNSTASAIACDCL